MIDIIDVELNSFIYQKKVENCFECPYCKGNWSWLQCTKMKYNEYVGNGQGIRSWCPILKGQENE